MIPSHLFLNTKQNGIFAGQTEENRRAENARGANEAGKNGHRIRIIVSVEKEETPEGHFECGDRWRPWRSRKWATTGMLVLIQREVDKRVRELRENLAGKIYSNSTAKYRAGEDWQYSTRNMRTVGQSPWDDIKILGQRLGHLISNSEPGGTAPSLIFSSFRCSMLVQ